MRNKLKAAQLHELHNIEIADTYVIYDCETKQKEEITDFEKAREVACFTSERKLVYAYNKKAEESGALSRIILLTPQNLSTYDKFNPKRKENL